MGELEHVSKLTLHKDKFRWGLKYGVANMRRHELLEYYYALLVPLVISAPFRGLEMKSYDDCKALLSKILRKAACPRTQRMQTKFATALNTPSGRWGRKNLMKHLTALQKTEAVLQVAPSILSGSCSRCLPSVVGKGSPLLQTSVKMSVQFLPFL
jgi:hypothetical protein